MAWDRKGDKFVTPDIFRKYLLITDSAFKKQESIDKIAVALPNVKIRKSFLNASDSNSPAKFSWAYDFKEDDSFYIFDGGISYYKEFENFSVAPTLEAHLASKDGSERDSMSARLAVEGYPFSDNNHYINFSPVYETDRRLETETVGADLWYSYANGRGGMGASKRLSKDNSYFYFRWRPYVGLLAGHVLDDGMVATLIEEKQFLRSAFKLDSFLSITESFSVTLSYKVVQELNSMKDTHTYFEIAPQLALDKHKHFSLGFTYKNGEDSSKFTDVESLYIWLGIKL